MDSNWDLLFFSLDAEWLHPLRSDCHLSLSQVEVKGHEKVRPWSLKDSKRKAAFPIQFQRGPCVSVMTVAAGTQKNTGSLTEDEISSTFSQLQSALALPLASPGGIAQARSQQTAQVTHNRLCYVDYVKLPHTPPCQVSSDV